MTAFVSEHGVNPRNSSAPITIPSVLRRNIIELWLGKKFTRAWVPALIVNGKYRIEGSMVGNSNLRNAPSC